VRKANEISKEKLLREAATAATVPAMTKARNTPMRQKLEKAIEEVGGEPLEGSGFEEEVPESELHSDNNDAWVVAPTK
jgi:hypothetical protein